jgi:hypothetical protein
MSVDSAITVANKSHGRSRVTNGSTLFAGKGDGRSAWARRLRDLCSEHVADLGGVDAVSVAERSIVRRCATLTCELERLEGKFATDGEASDSDLDLYSRVAGNLRRLLESLGLQRRAKDVTTDLHSYLLAAHQQAASPQGVGACVVLPSTTSDRPAPGHDESAEVDVARDTSDEAERTSESPARLGGASHD